MLNKMQDALMAGKKAEVEALVDQAIAAGMSARQILNEGLIVGIQTMRLSYYEFFGKFFTGGGRRYEPLALHPAENEG